MMGSVSIIGIGPGCRESMTPQALAALDRAEILIGQAYCLELVRELAPRQQIIDRHMSPIERSQLATNLCLAGKEVALVSSGDPGIYAIASTFFSYLRQRALTIPVRVIPGITVASAAAALLGAPLGHDFCLISLADLATPWSEIERRLLSAAESDFVIVLYNPRGKVGETRIIDVVAKLLALKNPETPVGIVTHATLENEKVMTTTLGEMTPSDVGTDSVVIIGNSETFIFGDKMITPRAYADGVGY